MSTPGFAAFRAVQVIEPSLKDGTNKRQSQAYQEVLHHFTHSTSDLYRKLTEHVVQQVVQLLRVKFQEDASVKSSQPHTFLIPCILLNLSFRPADNDLVMCEVQKSLDQRLSAHILRLSAASASAEQIKNKITEIILSSKHVTCHLGSSSSKVKTVSSVAYPILAKIAPKQQEPIVILLEYIERMDPRNLSWLISILSNNLNSIKVALVLTTNSDFYSLHTSISIKARDRIMYHEVKNQSAKVLFRDVINQFFLPGTYSFKLGPSSLNLLLDRFEFFDSSIGGVLHPIRAMLFYHFRELKDLSVLCSHEKCASIEAMKNISSQAFKSIHSSLSKLSSLQSHAVPKGSKSQLEIFISNCLDNIDQTHQELLKTLQSVFIFIYRSEGDSYLAKAFIECLKGAVNKSPSVKSSLEKLASFNMDEIERSTKYYLNNKGSHEKMNEIVEATQDELLIVKDSIESIKRDQSTKSEKVNLQDIRTRSCLQERLKKSIYQGTEKTEQIIAQFRGQILSQVKELLHQLKNPMSLPLSEVVYFDQASIICNLLYPPVRLEMMKKLKEKQPKGADITAGKKDSISMSTMFKFFSQSNSTIYTQDFLQEEANGHASKRAKLVIDDMEYIGLLEREKSGRIKKLVWE